MHHEIECSNQERVIAGFQRQGFTVSRTSGEEIEVSGKGWKDVKVKFKQPYSPRVLGVGTDCSARGFVTYALEAAMHG
jgi:hypothetical protein